MALSQHSSIYDFEDSSFNEHLEVLHECPFDKRVWLLYFSVPWEAYPASKRTAHVRIIEYLYEIFKKDEMILQVEAAPFVWFLTLSFPTWRIPIQSL